MCKNIVRMRFALQGDASLFHYVPHLVAAYFRQVVRKPVGVVCNRSGRLAAENILNNLLDILVLVSVECFAGRGRIAVQQPVVVARAVDIRRSGVILQQRAADAQTYIVSRVGAHAGYDLFCLLLAVEFQHHSVADLQVTRHGADTARQLFERQRHTYAVLVAR